MKVVPTVYTRTLTRAAEIVGGEDELARRLRVVPRRLSLWIRGVVAPPGDVFLIAADIVSEHGFQELSTKQKLAPQASTT
jgi:DNA-binding transcriptional regulator YdaS (Cro superfamily)